MADPKFVQIGTHPLERFRPLLGEEYAEIEKVAAWAQTTFAGRAIWHLSSTARGGGVAELLGTLLPYARDAGVDVRWVVMREGPEFFAITKRLHNHLHGDPGDGGALGDEARRVYEEVSRANVEALESLIQRGDIVYLHDPQTAGMVAPLCERGLRVVWRCHVGVDRPNDLVRGAWDFLRPYVEPAEAYIFSRREYRWEGLDEEKVWLMPPVIDPFSPKNQEIEPEVVEAILKEVGLLTDGLEALPSFERADGTPGRVERQATILQEEPVPSGAKVVAQVSRWDRLKDPLGLLEILARHLEDPALHLVLAGPDTEGVADDPEGAAVYAEACGAWRALGDEDRRRVHLVSLPMHDLEENGAMVNALQRRADVVVQKSIAEGFGLTVAEAMWKRRPVVGSCVGGIQDQIVDGETGRLVADPRDLAGFAAAIEGLLADPERAAAMGEAGRQRVVDSYLAVHRLREYVELLAALIDDAS
ncbi:MAG TPA: glycosyltransferase [Solirubrobacterales bacterium]|jgi:trehalose synthase|nr:glycosyltransferase [Solirubrobacterales bacterium]